MTRSGDVVLVTNVSLFHNSISVIFWRIAATSLSEVVHVLSDFLVDLTLKIQLCFDQDLVRSALPSWPGSRCRR